MPALIYKPATANERVFPLQVGLNGIGRHHDNRVCLRRSDVSRNHAEIVLTPKQALLKDLGSSNHSYVNGHKVEVAELNDGDELRFSSVRLTYRVAFEPEPEDVEETACEAPDADAEAEAQAAEIARKGRIEDGVTPERRAELEALVEQASAERPRSPSLLRLEQGTSADRSQLRLRLLLELANRLSAPTGVAQRMDLALKLVSGYLDVDALAVLESARKAGAGSKDGAGREPPRALAVRRRGGSQPLEQRFWDAAMARSAIAKGGPMLSVEKAAEGLGVRVEFCLPLGQVADALLCLASWHAAGAYSDEDMELVAEIAEQLGIALANARALDALRGE